MIEKVNLASLPLFCERLIKKFSQKQLVLLEGDLGLGKTTLVQEIARLMGFQTAESPTFSIINEYPTHPKIFHVDLYRMESDIDIESTGFWDIFLESNAYVFVEWPSRVPQAQWPKSWSLMRVILNRGDKEDERSIEVQTH